VIVRDYGFAPNPFGKYCTLATCKAQIRNSASIGDWIIGTGSAKYHATGKLVFAMRVDEKLDYNDYWNDERFQYKKPVLNGSLKQMYGDNIYYFDGKRQLWVQADSHHSYPDGSANRYNMDRDLKSKFVLISQHFWYFGRNAVKIPDAFSQICKKGRGYKCHFDFNFIDEFLQWLKKFPRGYNGDPLLFNSFERYDGIS
jgi:hypothetical protein